jgi:hypothetical protein
VCLRLLFIDLSVGWVCKSISPRSVYAYVLSEGTYSTSATTLLSLDVRASELSCGSVGSLLCLRRCVGLYGCSAEGSANVLVGGDGFRSVSMHTVG